MEITWLGHASFRLKNRDTTVIADPYGPESGLAQGRFGDAQVVLVSHDDPAHTNVEAVGGAPRAIRGPGEYEVAGVLITGVRTFLDTKRGAERGKNTAFVVEMDDVRICHLGALGHVPTPEQAEALNGTEVLLVPVGGHSTLDAETAAEVISLLEPRIVVPMLYRLDGTNTAFDGLDKFLKHMGIGEPQTTARLNVTKTNLPMETTVTVLEYRR